MQSARGTASAKAPVPGAITVPEWRDVAPLLRRRRNARHLAHAFWWNWHLNGKTFRFETRTKTNGAPAAIYRGTRKTEKYISGTMTAPSGLAGTWSMESSDPDASLAGIRALRSASPEEDASPATPLLSPAGTPLP